MTSLEIYRVYQGLHQWDCSLATPVTKSSPRFTFKYFSNPGQILEIKFIP